MAISVKDRYPSKIDTTDAAYPEGKARNIVNTLDGTGTPFEKDLVNDIFGLQQAIYKEAGITPSGIPDTADVSQQLEGIKKLTQGISTSTTTDLINSTLTYSADTVVTTVGFTTSGSGGAPWKQNGVTGQAVSQTPAQLGDGLLNDGNGNQWIMIKPADGYSIHSFNVFTGSDKTDEFKAALIAASGSVLNGNGGFYTVSEELRIKATDSGIKSADGSYLSIKNNTDGQAVLKIARDNPNLGEELSNILLKDVRLHKTGSTNGQVALKLHGIKSSLLDNFATLGCHTAIEVKGMTSLRLIKPLLFAGGGTITYQADTALITVDSFPLDAGGVIPAWPMSITAPNISSDFLSDYIFNIAAADGIQITNGYIASPKRAHFKLEPLSNNTGIANITCSNVYFDGINKDTGTENFLYVPSRSVTGTYISLVGFTGCNINNYKEEIFDIVGNFNDIKVNGGNLVSCKGDMIKSTSTGGDFSLSGVTVNNVASTTGKKLALVNGLNSLKFNENVVSNADSGLDIQNVNSAMVTENIFDSVASEITLANVSRYTTSGNLSTLSTLYDTSNNTGTFFPVLSFGGSSVGMTYSKQQGDWQLIGKWVFFSIHITLTSKGSSVGDMFLTNIPFSALEQSACSVDTRNMASSVTQTMQGISIDAGSVSGVAISTMASGVRVVATNADFLNNTSLRIAGMYRVN